MDISGPGFESSGFAGVFWSAYSDSPAALRASAGLKYPSALTTLPPRTVKTHPVGESISSPLPRPRACMWPNARTRSPRSRYSVNSVLSSSKLSVVSANHFGTHRGPGTPFPRRRR